MVTRHGAAVEVGAFPGDLERKKVLSRVRLAEFRAAGVNRTEGWRVILCARLRMQVRAAVETGLRRGSRDKRSQDISTPCISSPG